MVETLAPRGYAGRLRTTLVACATFAAGALAGGVVTFGGLALLGQRARRRRRRRGRAPPRSRCAAAVGEARGARIVPQVRRQVPESWRRVLPRPARRRPLRRPARARLHDLHPLASPCGRWRASASRSATRRSALRDRARLRRRPRAAGDRARARRGTERGARARRDGRAPAHPARAAARSTRVALAALRGRAVRRARPGRRDGRRRSAPPTRALDGAAARLAPARRRSARLRDAATRDPRAARHATRRVGGGRVGLDRRRPATSRVSGRRATFAAPGADALAVSASWVAWRARRRRCDVAQRSTRATRLRARRAGRAAGDARAPRAGRRTCCVFDVARGSRIDVDRPRAPAAHDRCAASARAQLRNPSVARRPAALRARHLPAPAAADRPAAPAAPVQRRPRALRHRRRPAAATPATSRAQLHRQGPHQRSRSGRARRRASTTRSGPRRSTADAAYVTRLRQRAAPSAPCDGRRMPARGSR